MPGGKTPGEEEQQQVGRESVWYRHLPAGQSGLRTISKMGVRPWFAKLREHVQEDK